MDVAVLGEIVYSLGKTMGMVASRLGPLYVCKRTGLSVDRKIFPQLAYRILLCSISQGSVQKKNDVGNQLLRKLSGLEGGALGQASENDVR